MDENEIAFAKQQHRLQDRTDAYLAVFGQNGSRTIHQEIVLADLERMTRYGDTAIERDNTGRYDGGLTAYKAGLQDVMKRIYLTIKWRKHNDQRSGNFEPSDAGG